jgi:hypothetical protein
MPTSLKSVDEKRWRYLRLGKAYCKHVLVMPGRPPEDPRFRERPRRDFFRRPGGKGPFCGMVADPGFPAALGFSE